MDGVLFEAAQNFAHGTITDNPLTAGATTINSAEFEDLPTVTAPAYLWIVLDPLAVNGDPEIVKVTAHSTSATSVTGTRAQQSTTARSHPSGTAWIAAWTTADADQMKDAIDALESGKVDAAGDTMTGMLTLPATTPTSANHATRKGYVDAEVSGVQDQVDDLNEIAHAGEATPEDTGPTSGSSALNVISQGFQPPGVSGRVFAMGHVNWTKTVSSDIFQVRLLIDGNQVAFVNEDNAGGNTATGRAICGSALVDTSGIVVCTLQLVRTSGSGTATVLSTTGAGLHSFFLPTV